MLKSALVRVRGRVPERDYVIPGRMLVPGGPEQIQGFLFFRARPDDSPKKKAPQKLQTTVTGHAVPVWRCLDVFRSHGWPGSAVFFPRQIRFGGDSAPLEL